MLRFKYVCPNDGFIWEALAKIEGEEEYCCPECGAQGDMINVDYEPDETGLDDEFMLSHCIRRMV